MGVHDSGSAVLASDPSEARGEFESSNTRQPKAKPGGSMEYQLFLLGRIIYGGYFLKAGINHFRSLEMLSGYAGMKGVPMLKVAVMFSGLLIIVGGLSVLTGFHPRYGLAAIILFLVPVSLMMHTFWSDTDPMQKLNNQINFEKNFAMAGAAMMLMLVPQPWPIVLL